MAKSNAAETDQGVIGIAPTQQEQETALVRYPHASQDWDAAKETAKEAKVEHDDALQDIVKVAKRLRAAGGVYRAARALRDMGATFSVGSHGDEDDE